METQATTYVLLTQWQFTCFVLEFITIHMYLAWIVQGRGQDAATHSAFCMNDLPPLTVVEIKADISQRRL